MDIQLFFNNQFFTGDLALASTDLALDESLETAVLISLFTDKRATVDGKAQRGWWGDTYADKSGDEIGSKLWLLSREKVMPLVRIQAKAYAEEALAWMIEDGLVKGYTVTVDTPDTSASLQTKATLHIEVVLHVDEQTSHTFRYDVGGHNALV